MSKLFEFMQDVSDELYSLVSDMESLLYEQPNTTLMKCRLYCEELVKRISEHENLEEVYPLNNAERIRKLYREEIIQEDIYRKLEWLRKMGNKAAHEVDAADIEDALKAHRFVFDISVWYMELYVSYDFVAPIYKLPLRDTSVKTANIDELMRPYLDETKKQLDSLWSEITQELEQIKKEKEKLAKDKEVVETKKDKVPFPIIEYLEKENLQYVDKRDKKGALWIVGDWSLHKKLNELKKYKIYFRFTKKGARSTKYQPAWFMLNKSLPLVDAEIIGEKEEVANEEKLLRPISFDRISEDYWLEKGQVLCPKHLENYPLPNDGEGLQYVNENYDVATFLDITEELLRQLYVDSRTHFYFLVNELYAHQFRFTGNLAQLLDFPLSENDWVLKVNDPEKTLDRIFPIRLRERLEKFSINTLKDLDNMLFSTLVWILKEDDEYVATLFDVDIKELIETARNENTRKFEKKEGKVDTENIESNHSPTVEGENVANKVEQASTEKSKEEAYKQLSFQGETLPLSEAAANIDIRELNIQGCNMMIRRLIGKGCYQLKDLPEQLDGIHESLQGVGPVTVEKFWAGLKAIVPNVPATTPKKNEEFSVRFDDQEVIIPKSILAMEILPEMFPENLESVVEALKENEMNFFRDLPTNLTRLLDFRGIGRVKVKRFISQLEQVVEECVAQEKLNSMSDEERYEYELNRYLDWYEQRKANPDELKKDKISPVYFELIEMKYKASLQNEHLTLEQLGNERGVTRERIRQILKKGDNRLLDRWKVLVSFIVSPLEEKTIAITDIDATNEAQYMLTHALEEMDIYYEKIDDISFLTKLSNREFNEYVEEVLKDVRQELSKQVVTKEQIKTFSEERAVEDRVPIEAIQAIVMQEIKWLAEDQGIIKSMTKADIVEMVMLQYPKGVEVYKKEPELIEKANDLMPGGFTAERSFHSIVGRDELQDTFYMWGRGHYIHSDFVNVDEEWLDEVIDLAASWLEKEEFIHIAKLYEAVEDEALKREIPNEYALYTLIRQRPQEKISLPRFPNVLPYGEDRLENHAWIVKFIEEKGRPVKVSELVEEFIEKKGWKRFTLDFNLSKSDKIIQYEHAVYTLRSFYDVDETKLRPIVSKLKGVMKDRKMLYLPAFFKENEMYLKSNGVPTPNVFYALLQDMELDSISLPRFPFVISGDVSEDTPEMKHMVETLIREESRIVAREEVSLWIDELLGGGSRALDIILAHTDDIFYYSRGQYGEYVHRDTIGMNEEKTNEVLAVANKKFAEISQLYNRNYASISELLDRDALPSLENDIEWNEELLSDVLKKSEKWRIIGTYHALLTPIDSDMKNEVDFIEQILTAKFDGAAKLTEFRKLLQEMRYSKDGSLLNEVNEALEKGEAPFAIVGDEIIHKQLLEGSITS